MNKYDLDIETTTHIKGLSFSEGANDGNINMRLFDFPAGTDALYGAGTYVLLNDDYMFAIDEGKVFSDMLIQLIQNIYTIPLYIKNCNAYKHYLSLGEDAMADADMQKEFQDKLTKYAEEAQKQFDEFWVNGNYGSLPNAILEKISDGGTDIVAAIRLDSSDNKLRTSFFLSTKTNLLYYLSMILPQCIGRSMEIIAGSYDNVDYFYSEFTLAHKCFSLFSSNVTIDECLGSRDIFEGYIKKNLPCSLQAYIPTISDSMRKELDKILSDGIRFIDSIESEIPSEYRKNVSDVTTSYGLTFNVRNLMANSSPRLLDVSNFLSNFMR